jgi:hypothetical protein
MVIRCIEGRWWCGGSTVQCRQGGRILIQKSGLLLSHNFSEAIVLYFSPLQILPLPAHLFTFIAFAGGRVPNL